MSVAYWPFGTTAYMGLHENIKSSISFDNIVLDIAVSYVFGHSKKSLQYNILLGK